MDRGGRFVISSQYPPGRCGLSRNRPAWTPSTSGSIKRVKGIEPSSLAWKAIALPLSYTRSLWLILFGARVPLGYWWPIVDCESSPRYWRPFVLFLGSVRVAVGDVFGACLSLGCVWTKRPFFMCSGGEPVHLRVASVVRPLFADLVAVDLRCLDTWRYVIGGCRIRTCEGNAIRFTV